MYVAEKRFEKALSRIDDLTEESKCKAEQIADRKERDRLKTERIDDLEQWDKRKSVRIADLEDENEQLVAWGRSEYWRSSVRTRAPVSRIL